MEEIQERLIEEEMKEAYVDYAMSVITARALPDVNDGLKPVHRRILYAMNKLNLQHNKPHRKSAYVVGRVLAELHPHGDAAVYDALARMAQNFSLRYPLIDGQGNWGSIDGDKQASMRYTEARLTRLSSEMLADIEKNTVKMTPNYDESSQEPVILPTKIPNLLVNGSSGIAVGMATNIPPHNMNEVLDAVIFLIDNSNASIDELMNIVKGPDFPTGSFILGKSAIRNAYKTGRGKIKIRSKTEIEDNKDKKRIIVTEIPYMINKSFLIENIVNLVRDKRIEGISDIRDESDRRGMRIVIELKKGEDAEVVRNNLFKYSQLQTTFGVISLALVAGQPKLLNLKDILYFFIEHRKRVIIRRTEFDLGNAEKRAHILSGLRTALENIDFVVKLIKGSESPLVAKNLLIKNLRISKMQAEAILDMRLHRLTSLEQGKIKKEYDDLLNLIKELREILGSEARILEIIKKECLELKEKYGDGRRTEILEEEEELEVEDLIEEENVVVTVTHSGYVKRISLDEYKEQRRGGKGVKAAGTKEEDFVENIFISSTHDYILFFSDKGKVYWLKAYNIPEGARYSRGKAIINLLNLKDEKINAMIPIKGFDGYLVMVTKKGIVKRIKLDVFSNPRRGGIIAIKLDGDELVDVKLTDGNQKLIIASANGNAVKFKEEDVRVMGRNSYGVRGMKLEKDMVIGMEIARDSLLTVTENGYGKRTNIDEYRLIRRGGKGVINIKTSKRNGKVIGIKTVKEDDEIICISENGILIRIPVNGISEIGRNTQGVIIMKLNEKDRVNGVAKILKSEEVIVD